MPKINRYNGNVVPFAGDRLAGEKFVFGSSTTDSDELSDQLTTQFLRGYGTVGPSEFPPLEWFNALGFTTTQFISYLHQMGVAEWNSQQEYPTEGAVCTHNGKLWIRGSIWTIGDEPGVSGSWSDSAPLGEVSPVNNDWNGYLDPAHTVQIEFEDTSAGTRAFAADTEIAPNIFTSDTSNITFADDGWVFDGAIYKKFTFTAEQLALIDINTINVFIKDELGNEHFVSNATNGVNVTKPSATELGVELTNAIFTTLSITKVWRFFATDKVGQVAELGPLGLLKKTGKLYTFAEDLSGIPNGTILSWTESVLKFSEIVTVGFSSGVLLSSTMKPETWLTYDVGAAAWVDSERAFVANTSELGCQVNVNAGATASIIGVYGRA